MSRIETPQNGIRCARVFDEDVANLATPNGRKGERGKWTNVHILPATARLHTEKNTAVPIATTLKT
jgi:hypothetical protein